MGRTAVRAHHGIDVSVVPHVEDARGAGTRGNGHNGDDASERTRMDRRDDEAHNRRKHCQEHNARLHQRDEVGKADAQVRVRPLLPAKDRNRPGFHVLVLDRLHSRRDPGPCLPRGRPLWSFRWQALGWSGRLG